MPVDVLKTDEGATFALAGILERPLMELHVGVVVEQDVTPARSPSPGIAVP